MSVKNSSLGALPYTYESESLDTWIEKSAFNSLPE